MERLLWICAAGAAGAGTRYLVGLWAAHRLGGWLPYGTLLVNVVGCFLIAVIVESALTASWSADTRAAATVGFIGGLTTYSSFNYESIRLAQDGVPGGAALYMAMTVACCLAAGWLGHMVSR